MTGIVFGLVTLYVFSGVVFYALASAARRADNAGGAAYAARLAKRRNRRIALVERTGRKHKDHFAMA